MEKTKCLFVQNLTADATAACNKTWLQNPVTRSMLEILPQLQENRLTHVPRWDLYVVRVPYATHSHDEYFVQHNYVSGVDRVSVLFESYQSSGLANRIASMNKSPGYEASLKLVHDQELALIDRLARQVHEKRKTAMGKVATELAAQAVQLEKQRARRLAEMSAARIGGGRMSDCHYPECALYRSTKHSS